MNKMHDPRLPYERRPSLPSASSDKKPKSPLGKHVMVAPVAAPPVDEQPVLFFNPPPSMRRAGDKVKAKLGDQTYRDTFVSVAAPAVQTSPKGRVSAVKASKPTLAANLASRHAARRAQDAAVLQHSRQAVRGQNLVEESGSAASKSDADAALFMAIHDQKLMAGWYRSLDIEVLFDA